MKKLIKLISTKDKTNEQVVGEVMTIGNERRRFYQMGYNEAEVDLECAKKQVIGETLIEILAYAESMTTAREVRHLIKDYILKLK